MGRGLFNVPKSTRGGGDYMRSVYLRADGESCRIRFLTEADDIFWAYFHQVTRGGRFAGWKICLQEAAAQTCTFCDAGGPLPCPTGVEFLRRRRARRHVHFGLDVQRAPCRRVDAENLASALDALQHEITSARIAGAVFATDSRLALARRGELLAGAVWR